MSRAALQTLSGCLLALAIGASAAFMRPRSFTNSAAPPSSPAVAPAPESEPQIDGPLATAYRSATGAKRWLLLVSASERATAGEMSTLIRTASIRMAAGSSRAMRMSVDISPAVARSLAETRSSQRFAPVALRYAVASGPSICGSDSGAEAAVLAG